MTYLPPRRKRQPLGIREPSHIRCESHLRWLRGHVCLCHKTGECSERMEAHHVREGHLGMSTKPNDSEGVPLCSNHHSELHNKGVQTFEAKYRLNLLSVAADMWRASPHGRKYRMEHGE